MFIVLEGLDGSGKSTQLFNMMEYVKKEYPTKKVLFTREPGGHLNDVGEKLRQVLLNNEMDDYTRVLLYAASRYEHSKIIKKYIDDGYIVICDRYIYSSMAYQATSLTQMERILSVNNFSDLVKPNHVLYYNIDIETYNKRKAKRQEERELDVFEKKSDEFFSNVKDKYEIAFDMTDANLTRIDANKSLEEVTSETLRIIDVILKEEY